MISTHHSSQRPKDPNGQGGGEGMGSISREERALGQYQQHSFGRCQPTDSSLRLRNVLGSLLLILILSYTPLAVRIELAHGRYRQQVAAG